MTSARSCLMNLMKMLIGVFILISSAASPAAEIRCVEASDSWLQVSMVDQEIGTAAAERDTRDNNGWMPVSSSTACAFSCAPLFVITPPPPNVHDTYADARQIYAQAAYQPLISAVQQGLKPPPRA